MNNYFTNEEVAELKKLGYTVNRRSANCFSTRITKECVESYDVEFREEGSQDYVFHSNWPDLDSAISQAEQLWC